MQIGVQKDQRRGRDPEERGGRNSGAEVGKHGRGGVGDQGDVGRGQRRQKREHGGDQHEKENGPRDLARLADVFQPIETGEGFGELRTGEVGAGQVLTSKTGGLLKIDVLQPCAAQARRPRQIRATQIRAAQIGLGELYSGEVRTLQVGGDQHRLAQAAIGEQRLGQFRLAEVAALKVDASQVGALSLLLAALQPARMRFQGPAQFLLGQLPQRFGAGQTGAARRLSLL